MLSPKSPPRRSLLKRGLVGGALLTAGGMGWVGLRATRLGADPQRPLRVLSREEYAVADAIATSLLPTSGEHGEWPSPRQLCCVEKLDDLLAQLHAETSAEIRQLLRLFDNGASALLTGDRLTPFTQLDDAAKVARLEAWRRSRVELLRSGYLALTRLMHATYYASPEVYSRLGYPGPPEVPSFPETSSSSAPSDQPESETP